VTCELLKYLRQMRSSSFNSFMSRYIQLDNEAALVVEKHSVTRTQIAVLRRVTVYPIRIVSALPFDLQVRQVSGRISHWIPPADVSCPAVQSLALDQPLQPMALELSHGGTTFSTVKLRRESGDDSDDSSNMRFSGSVYLQTVDGALPDGLSGTLVDVHTSVVVEGPIYTLFIASSQYALTRFLLMAPSSQSIRFNFVLPTLSLSLISDLNSDVACVTVFDIDLCVVTNSSDARTDFSVARVQIDNQHMEADLPVAMRNILSSASTKEFFRLSMVLGRRSQTLYYETVIKGRDAESLERVLGAAPYWHIKDANVIVQEAAVCADERFVSGCVKWGMNAYSRITASSSWWLHHVAHRSRWSLEALSRRRLFVDSAKLHAFEIELTVRFKGHSPSTDELRRMLKMVGIDVVDINCARIAVGVLNEESSGMTVDEMFASLLQHLQTSLMFQLHKLLFSSAIIGDPAGLLRGVQRGVGDAMSRQDTIGRKARVLLHHTVSGTMNSLGKFVGSVGSGVASLAMDEQFVTNRRKFDEPTSFAEGLQQGKELMSLGFSNGLDGLSSLTRDNLSLASLGRGVIGLAMKPVAGVLDGASTIALGISRENNIQSERETPPMRTRVPCRRSMYRPVTPYNRTSALEEFVVLCLVQSGVALGDDARVFECARGADGSADALAIGLKAVCCARLDGKGRWSTVWTFATFDVMTCDVKEETMLNYCGAVLQTAFILTMSPPPSSSEPKSHLPCLYRIFAMRLHFFISQRVPIAAFRTAVQTSLLPPVHPTVI
jgi:hypothetical protein